MPEYTALTVVAVLAVVALELWGLRTGIFRTRRYWISMVIVLGFQIPVDGYLTRLADPIVLYDARQTLGIRFPWDIPIEDFGFGWAMVTLTILLWRRCTDGPSRRAAAGRAVPGRPSNAGAAAHREDAR
ncbi:lycopene cyclase domain-containing protein [Nakamurella endophytica]|uniref:Lycopene cyclase domain-containing protein n=1 Tax=Nakamurella endophytica TaxID=1748367 RepID=A0A917T7I4_9ACTN|nr:lycopene cyclase domain-containing protein [Nakamurella endophytica]GGM12099.1 hypothetical protein GCM10011594_34940 [Nakamurella endophytica]